MPPSRPGAPPNRTGIAPGPSPPRPDPAAIGRDSRAMSSGVFGKTVMAKDIIRIALNERLVKGAHWAVFAIGLLSLTFSVAATAASAL